MKNKIINQQYKNKFHKLYLAGFFIILALPLLAFSPLFFPPEWAKGVIFKMVFSAILFLFFWQFLSDRQFYQNIILKIKQQKTIFILLSCLLLSFFLSTLFSSDILFSLWASPHRSGGAVIFTFFILFSVLLFLITKKEDWQKFWDFSFLVGSIIVIFGALQYFNVFPNILVSYGRPVSTLSNSILFALYLIILFFPAIWFALKEKTNKKYFYWISVALFVFGILISGSRAAYIGLVLGGFYFLFFYPAAKKRNSIMLKIIPVLLLSLAIFAFYFANTEKKLPEFLEKSQIVQSVKNRLSIGLIVSEPRFSAWQIALNAIKEKPLLGWGPENFSIGFDKYYDPSLPYITKEWGSWWDRAHNIFFDLAVGNGLIFTIIYFLFFGFLLYKIPSHSLKSLFIAYFSALFFSFDSISTYIILFFVIGYSLYLISSNSAELSLIVEPKNAKKWEALNKKRKIIMIISFLFFIIFLWKYNLKPLLINGQINKAEKMSCENRLKKIENLFSKKSFLDPYVRLKYAEHLKLCAEENQQNNLETLKKGVDALKQTTKIRPNYTRAWLMLGGIETILLATEQDPKIKETLSNEINYYFQKAASLGPKHQETYAEWAKFYFAINDFEKMEEKSEYCVSLNQDTNSCYWYLGLAEIVLGDEKQGKEHIEIAKLRRFPYDTLSSYGQLAIVYTKTQNAKELAPVYEALIKIDSENIQYKATMAFVYKELGEYKKAKEMALKILDLAPEMKNEIDTFLNTLPR